MGLSVYQDNLIGTMGSTGSSSAPHVHIDCVRGYIPRVYRLKDIDFDRGTIEQLKHFVDAELFHTKILITSYFGDPDYVKSSGEWVFHPAYDVVPENRHKTKDNYNIYWNRSAVGYVISKGFDDAYGHYINIGFDA